MSVSTHDFNSHLGICLKEAVTDKKRPVIPIQYLCPDATSSTSWFDCDLECIGSRRVGKAVVLEINCLDKKEPSRNVKVGLQSRPPCQTFQRAHHPLPVVARKHIFHGTTRQHTAEKYHEDCSTNPKHDFPEVLKAVLRHTCKFSLKYLLPVVDYVCPNSGKITACSWHQFQRLLSMKARIITRNGSNFRRRATTYLTHIECSNPYSIGVLVGYMSFKTLRYIFTGNFWLIEKNFLTPKTPPFKKIVKEVSSCYMIIWCRKT